MPKFQKGHTKTGGRKKGTLNADCQHIVDLCKKYHFDPMEAMIVTAKEDADPDRRFNAACKIAEYVYPKRSAMKLEMDEETTKNAIELFVTTQMSENSRKA